MAFSGVSFVVDSSTSSSFSGMMIFFWPVFGDLLLVFVFELFISNVKVNLPDGA